MKYNNFIKTFNKSLGAFGPIVIWIMVSLIPSIIGLHIFKYVDKTKIEINKAKARQNLLTEAFKFNADLNANTFLSDSLDANNSHKLYSQWLKQKKLNNFKENLKINPTSSHLSSFTGNSKSELLSFINFIETKLGIKPDIALLYSADPTECAYILNKPFKVIFSDRQMIKILQKGHQAIKQCFIATNDIHHSHNNYPHYHDADISKILGIMRPIRVRTGGIENRFSIITKGIIYTINFMHVNSEHKIRLIQLTYVENNLKPKLIFKYAQQKHSNSSYKFKLGLTKSTSLPLFIETNERLTLVTTPTEYFQRVYKRINFIKPGYRLAIKITLEKHTKIFDLQFKTVSFIIKLFLMLSLLFAVGYALKKFKLFQYLRQMMVVAFIAGILFPLTNLIWLTISYISVYREKVAENQLTFMQQKLDELEDQLRLEKFIQNSYVRQVANQINTFSLKQRREIHKYIHFNDTSTQGKLIRQNFHSVFLINNDGTSYFRFKDKKRGINIQENNTASYMKGPLLLALSKLKAFDWLSTKQQSNILQQAELLVELFANIFDSKAVGSFLASEGNFNAKDYAVSKNYLSMFILKDKHCKPNGICCLGSSNGGWFNKFLKKNNKTNYYKKYFKQNNFKTAIYLLRTNKLHEREIYTTTGIDKRMNSINITNLSSSLFSKSDTSRINNISQHQKPHLIVAEYINDLDIYAIAYAMPIQAHSKPAFIIFLSGLILLIIISSITLALGIASILLINIPQFSTAIKLTEQKNYKWHINTTANDEFGALSSAFNHMATKMIERQKLGELVSQNVINAISSEKDSMLKPGGERVNASILFADIRSFTTISETYSADEVVEMLNDYFTIMSVIIEKYDGIIDKFIGDAIQAVFYENTNLSTSIRATKASIEMLDALEELNSRRRINGKFTIQNGIGITTGQVISGRVGTEDGKLDATIIGNKLTQAMELEGLSKFAITTPILLDENTQNSIATKYNTITFSPPHSSKLAIQIFELKL